MQNLPYRAPPTVPTVVVGGMMLLLTYGSWMVHTGRGSEWFSSHPHGAFDSVALGFLFRLNTALFGSDAVMVYICVMAWIAHVAEAGVSFVKARANGATLVAASQYGAGSFFVGFLQMQALSRAIKRQTKKK